MTQEDKQLLLKDLCGRLPYGVKVTNGIYTITLTPCSDTSIIIKNGHILPYLRPMSSMTEEEYESVSWEGCSYTYNYSSISGFRFVEIKTYTLNILNWLNAHHFDYRNLIPRGLALKASEDMYREEQQ